ncbi:MAG TPA: hypothetical protein VHN14_31630 [Kofleriaceae bacterium]|nr:hypothetical protein [Kofleriaceae bacterium]
MGRHGVVLADDEERWNVQSLLDHWATTLERAERPGLDSWLVDFDLEQAPALPNSACPYLGLNAFQEHDGDKFFGRDALVSEFVQHLGAHRCSTLCESEGVTARGYPMRDRVHAGTRSSRKQRGHHRGAGNVRAVVERGGRVDFGRWATIPRRVRRDYRRGRR